MKFNKNSLILDALKKASTNSKISWKDFELGGQEAFVLNETTEIVNVSDMLDFSQDFYISFLGEIENAQLLDSDEKKDFIYEFINAYVEETLKISKELDNFVEENKELFENNQIIIDKMKQPAKNVLLYLFENPFVIVYRNELKEKMLNIIEDGDPSTVYGDPYISTPRIFRNKSVGFGCYSISAAIGIMNTIGNKEMPEYNALCALGKYLYSIENDDRYNLEIISSQMDDTIFFFKDFFMKKMELYIKTYPDTHEYINAYSFINAIVAMEREIVSTLICETDDAVKNLNLFDEIFNKYPELTKDGKIKKYVLYTNAECHKEYNFLISEPINDNYFKVLDLVYQFQDDFPHVKWGISSFNLATGDSCMHIEYNSSSDWKDKKLDKLIPYILKDRLAEDINQNNKTSIVVEGNQYLRKLALQEKIDDLEINTNDIKKKKKI